MTRWKYNDGLSNYGGITGNFSFLYNFNILYWNCKDLVFTFILSKNVIKKKKGKPYETDNAVIIYIV